MFINWLIAFFVTILSTFSFQDTSFLQSNTNWTEIKNLVIWDIPKEITSSGTIIGTKIIKEEAISSSQDEIFLDGYFLPKFKITENTPYIVKWITYSQPNKEDNNKILEYLASLGKDSSTTVSLNFIIETNEQDKEKIINSLKSLSYDSIKTQLNNFWFYQFDLIWGETAFIKRWFENPYFSDERTESSLEDKTSCNAIQANNGEVLFLTGVNVKDYSFCWAAKHGESLEISTTAKRNYVYFFGYGMLWDTISSNKRVPLKDSLSFSISVNWLSLIKTDVEQDIFGEDYAFVGAIPMYEWHSITTGFNPIVYQGIDFDNVNVEWIVKINNDLENFSYFEKNKDNTYKYVAQDDSVLITNFKKASSSSLLDLTVFTKNNLKLFSKNYPEGLSSSYTGELSNKVTILSNISSISWIELNWNPVTVDMVKTKNIWIQDLRDSIAKYLIESNTSISKDLKFAYYSATSDKDLFFQYGINGDSSYIFYNVYLIDYSKIWTDWTIDVYSHTFRASDFVWYSYSFSEPKVISNSISYSEMIAVQNPPGLEQPIPSTVSLLDRYQNKKIATLYTFQLELPNNTVDSINTIDSSLFNKTSSSLSEAELSLIGRNSNSSSVWMNIYTTLGSEYYNIREVEKEKWFLLYPFDFVGSIYKSVGEGNKIELDWKYKFNSFTDGMLEDSIVYNNVDNTLTYGTWNYGLIWANSERYKIAIKTNLSFNDLKNYKVRLVYTWIFWDNSEEIDLQSAVWIDSNKRVLFSVDGYNVSYLFRNLLTPDVRKTDSYWTITYTILNKNNGYIEDSWFYPVYLEQQVSGIVNALDDKTWFTAGGLVYRAMDSYDSYEVFKVSLNELKGKYVHNWLINVCFQQNNDVFITPSSYLNQWMQIPLTVNGTTFDNIWNILNKTYLFEKKIWDTGKLGENLVQTNVIWGNSYNCFPIIISDTKIVKFQDNSLYFSVKRKDVTKTTIQNVKVLKYINYSDGYNPYTPSEVEQTESDYSVKFLKNENSSLSMQFYNPVSETSPLLSFRWNETSSEFLVNKGLLSDFMYMKLTYTPRFGKQTSTDRINAYYSGYGDSTGRNTTNYCGDWVNCVSSQNASILNWASKEFSSKNWIPFLDYYDNNTIPFFAHYWNKIGSYIWITNLWNSSKWITNSESFSSTNVSRDTTYYTYRGRNTSWDYIDSNGSSLYSTTQSYDKWWNWIAYSPVKKFTVNMEISTPVREWIVWYNNWVPIKQYIYYVEPQVEVDSFGNGKIYDESSILFVPESNLGDSVQKGNYLAQTKMKSDWTLKEEPVIVFNDKFQWKIESVSFQMNKLSDASSFERVANVQSLYQWKYTFKIFVTLKDLSAAEKYSTNLEFQRLLQEGGSSLFTIHFPAKFSGSFSSVIWLNYTIPWFAWEEKQGFSVIPGGTAEVRTIDNIISAITSLDAEKLQNFTYSTDVYKYLYTTWNIWYLETKYKKVTTTTCGTKKCNTSRSISKLSENYVSLNNNWLIDITNWVPIKYEKVDNWLGVYNSVVSAIWTKVNYYWSFFWTDTNNKVNDLKNWNDKDKIAWMCSYFSNNKTFERITTSSPYDVWDLLQDSKYNDWKIRVLRYTGTNNLILNSSANVINLAWKWILISNSDVTIWVDVHQILSNTNIDDNFLTILAAQEDCSSYKDIYIWSSVVSLQNTVLIWNKVKTTFTNSPLSIQWWVISDSFQCFRNSVQIYRLNDWVKDSLWDSDETLEKDFEGSSNNAQVYGNYKSNGCNVIENPLLNTILYKKEMLEK